LSAAGFERDPSAELALLELRQGIDANQSPEFPIRRRDLYDLYGRPDDPWVEKARAAYAAMSRHDGLIASVGDQLAAELDVREHAELYAAVGGFDVTEITQGLGAWWSPSATWFRDGPIFAEAPYEGPEPIETLLRDAGANALANFFATVVEGGLPLVGSPSLFPWRRRRQREFAFIISVAHARSLLFRAGPDERGHYLRDDKVSSDEILDAIGGRRWFKRSDTPVVR
jgi:hypothetical protein